MPRLEAAALGELSLVGLLACPAGALSGRYFCSRFRRHHALLLSSAPAANSLSGRRSGCAPWCGSTAFLESQLREQTARRVTQPDQVIGNGVSLVEPACRLALGLTQHPTEIVGELLEPCFCLVDGDHSDGRVLRDARSSLLSHIALTLRQHAIAVNAITSALTSTLAEGVVLH